MVLIKYNLRELKDELTKENVDEVMQALIDDNAILKESCTGFNQRGIYYDYDIVCFGII